MDSCRIGKCEVTQEAQMHLDVSESTANVRHVLEEVQQRWGGVHASDTGWPGA